MPYEYKFVVIRGWFWFAATKQKEYRGIIEEHAREGWRLVQIFAPTGEVLMMVHRDIRK